MIKSLDAPALDPPAPLPGMRPARGRVVVAAVVSREVNPATAG